MKISVCKRDKDEAVQNAQAAEERQESAMWDETKEERRPSRETYIFHGANETAQCGSMDALSFSGLVGLLSVPTTAPSLWDGGTSGDQKVARWCRTLRELSCSRASVD
ncbi:hypothetical protein ALC60_09689 [Trachymyrmex zeteki]|uniref:Uncharacterized protein n=1 Tax=Mycetomoellerius zeteki TaxID=64791 RepID=A0A151WTR0_9HYME|nr:hypothetical protein ALC60_09689 [Trachymyrmex zeteki]